jgi:RimJ/RimL family protein N-acetyltransferase
LGYNNVMIDTLTPLDIQSMNGADATRLWNHVRQQTVCFDDLTRDRGDVFAQRLVAPTTMSFAYKDDGLILIENIVPRLQGDIHFYVWGSLSEAEITQVGREACRQAFDTYKLHRISAYPPAFNKLACRIAARVGFKYEGCMRQLFLHEGRYQDVFIYGLLAQEFATLAQGRHE